MRWLEVVVLAAGLAADAAAASAARGAAVPRIRPRHVLSVALWFGGFQALMPLLGSGLGAAAGPLLGAVSRGLSAALLLVLGAKLLWEARSAPDVGPATTDPFASWLMLGLALATSVDALAAGFALPLLGAPVALSVATIGVTTAVLSALGLVVGHRLGRMLGQRIDALGGVLLIALGLKVALASGLPVGR